MNKGKTTPHTRVRYIEMPHLANLPYLQIQKQRNKIFLPVTAAMQVYNTAEWSQEDSTSNEMRMHSIHCLLSTQLKMMLYRSRVTRLYSMLY